MIFYLVTLVVFDNREIGKNIIRREKLVYKRKKESKLHLTLTF